jgi:lipopolysaccharide export system permease protein
MLFDSSLRQELARSFGGTLAVTLTTLLTMVLIRALGEAAGGDVAPQDVAMLLAYSTLGHLPTVLSLSLFVAVVSTLTRLFRDSEMAVWRASGVSLLRFIRPVLRVAAPVILLIAGLVMVIWPWSNRQIDEMRQRFERRSDLSRVAPGQFQVSADGRRIFFIDRNSPDALDSRHLFIVDRAVAGRESVTTAQSGRLETVESDRFLVLRQGTRVEQTDNQLAKSVAHFDEYRVRIGETSLSRLSAASPKALDTWELLSRDDRALDAELCWRFGAIFAAFNLTLFGIALPAGNPRRPNSGALLMALLTFVVYLNLTNLSQTWVAAGRISLLGGVFGLHGVLTLGALALLSWRDSGPSARPWQLWRRSPAPHADASR